MKKNIAIQTLRAAIINSIQQTPSKTYKLWHSLRPDVSTWFSDDFGYAADFTLNLETKSLYVVTSTYPEWPTMRVHERVHGLNASNFHKKAVAFNMPSELQGMKTDEDWQALFDDQLNTAISNAIQKLNEQQDKQKNLERISYGIVIPEGFEHIKPSMDFEIVRLRQHLTYGSNVITLENMNGQYQLTANNHSRTLSSTEAAWVEQKIKDGIIEFDKNCIKPKNGTRLSLSERIELSRRDINVDFHAIIEMKNKPETYECQLSGWSGMGLLFKLAEYGSVSVTEKKNRKE